MSSDFYIFYFIVFRFCVIARTDFPHLFLKTFKSLLHLDFILKYDMRNESIFFPHGHPVVSTSFIKTLCFLIYLRYCLYHIWLGRFGGFLFWIIGLPACLSDVRAHCFIRIYVLIPNRSSPTSPLFFVFQSFLDILVFLFFCVNFIINLASEKNKTQLDLYWDHNMHPYGTEFSYLRACVFLLVQTIFVFSGEFNVFPHIGYSHFLLV